MIHVKFIIKAFCIHLKTVKNQENQIVTVIVHYPKLSSIRISQMLLKTIDSSLKNQLFWNLPPSRPESKYFGIYQTNKLDHLVTERMSCTKYKATLKLILPL